MGHDHDEHDDHGHGKYPGPHTHQSAWVMWATIVICLVTCAVILGVGAIT